MADKSDGLPEDRDATSRPASKSSRSSTVDANAAPTNPPDRSMTEESTTALEDSTSTAADKTPPEPSTPPKMGDSQPMTASSSSSSHPSLRESGTAGATAPAPYGTRSRNRTAGSRPNYAEDKETEMEYEYTGATNNSSSNPPKSALAVEEPQSEAAQPPKASGVSTRRAAASTTNSQVSSNGVPSSAAVNSKEVVTGVSTFPAAPTSGTTTVSKKRKAGASSGPTGTLNPSGPGQVTTRRTSMAVGASSQGKLLNMLSFEMSQGYLKHGKLKADDGTTLAVNDHVYLICEPPGEPYYLARIMEFLHSHNEPSNPIDAIRVNWYYRPRDIQRKVTDTRVVFASMHSDTCPLTSLRGKCKILHRTEVDDIDEYRKTKDCFWYEKMFDRYIHRYYEVIATSQVINVPAKVKKVLDERWRFVIVEMGRGKELTSAVKSCKRCSQYSASNDSVECAVCHSTYHMNCVRPPLLKKPSRGFAWACGPCSRAQEKKLEARNTPIVNKNPIEGEEEEIFDEEEEHPVGGNESPGGSGLASDDQDTTIHPATAEQLAHARLWPYRYLGIHCRVEDALDYDDRIYPRASSRLGPRHQANVNVWHGRPVELVKPADIKRKYVKGGAHKKDAKLSKETLAALEADKQAKERRPKWVLDEPPGYVRRGEDSPNSAPENTSKTIFRLPGIGEHSSRGEDEFPALASKSQEEREELIDDYMKRAKSMAKSVGVDEYTTNFLDKALEVFYGANFDADAALKKVKSFHRKKDLKEPDLNKEELKRFEEGITKYGSELQTVGRHVRTQPQGDIVRFYYTWKKTDRGKQIWGNYEGRKGKKEAKKYDAGQSKLVDDVADDFDDSAFDNDKAVERKRGFECKFCATHKSRQWRRAPGVSPGTTVSVENPAKTSGKDKAQQYVLALCRRCGELWRRYGIQWEDIEEVAKKVAQGGGRAWKRRIDEELLKELMAANEAALTGTKIQEDLDPLPIGKEAVATSQSTSAQEPMKKKQKIASDKDRGIDPTPSTTAVPPPAIKVKKVPEKPERSPTPEMPKPRILPCSVCTMMEPLGDQHLSCKECRMTVHRQCYGIGDVRHPSKWVCDTCSNDKNPQVSTCYECVLCPVKHTEHDFVEPAKATHKKKNDKDREKEKVERDRAVAAAKFYNQKQEEMNRPVNPREPLKRTAGNNWVHVTCAVWTPEMKFGNAKALEPLEGIGTIPPLHFERVCKICETSNGACITCHQCHAPVHITCAQQNGYTLGFDVTPVKSSRRDVVNTVTIGEESGQMAAVVWCKDHASSIKTIVHYMDEVVDDTGLNALQLFVRNFKQADLTLTGTVRKANLVNLSTRAISQFVNPTSSMRRTSTTANGTSFTPTSATRSTFKNEDTDGWPISSSMQPDDASSVKKVCYTCGIDVSPKWWPFTPKIPQPPSVPYSSSTPYSTQPAMTNGDGINGHFRGPSDPLYSSSSATRPEQSSLSNGHVSQQDNAVNMNRPPTGASRSTDTLQCHKCHWRKIKEPSPPIPIAQPVLQPVRPAHVPAAPALASPQMPWVPHHLPSVQTQGYMEGSPDTIMTDNVDRNGFTSPKIRVASHLPHHAYPSHIPGPGHAHPPPPSHTSPQQLSSTIHGPPHMMAPASKSTQPPNGNVPGYGSAAPYGSGRPGPELHYHPPQPMGNQQVGQLPLMSFGGPHGSPPLSHNRPSTPRDQVQGGNVNGTRAPSEGRTPGGASASPSLRNLLH